MRARFIGALAAGAALVASVMISGSASAANWTVTPGNAFTGSSGVTKLKIQETGVQLQCTSASAAGTAKSGSNQVNPLATLPAPNGVKFNSCSGPFGLTFTVAQVGTWNLNGTTYNAATGVTTGTITNITANITGPGCNATVTGSVNVTYTNSTHRLAVLPNYTLLISFVSPTANCLGLIGQGNHASFDGNFLINPALVVTSP
jgi:hypothetical protein